MEGAGDCGDRSDRLRPRLVDHPTTLCRLGQCSRFYRELMPGEGEKNWGFDCDGRLRVMTLEETVEFRACTCMHTYRGTHMYEHV